MNPSLRFRQILSRHLLSIVAVGAAASSLALGACAGTSGGGGGSGGGTGGTGGSGGAGGQGGHGDDAGPTWQPISKCFDPPDGGVCPSLEDAPATYGNPVGPCGGIFAKGPTEMNGQCCYELSAYSCMSGRPFVVGDRARTAGAQRVAQGGGSWGADARPAVEVLPAAAREALADAWLADALAEHASIASFARFSLELLQAGAPADLIDDAHAAARDEIRHAQRCFALASAYAGAPIEPSGFPLGPSVALGGDLAALATATVREGCIGETLAAIRAAEQLARATDPAVREALATIASDEARHAELAWRAVAWAIRAGGDRVRAAVEEAFASIQSGDLGPCAKPGADADLLARHGLLDAASLRSAMARGIEGVVLPSARALLDLDAAAA